MNLAHSQDILYLVGAVSVLAVSGFLCWVLYEIARLVRQTNDVVEETREKVSRVERAVVNVTEKLGTASQYLGVLAEGGKQLISLFAKRETSASEPKKRAPKLSRMPDEDEEEEET